MSTSWQPVADWYSEAVGEKGHYYHQHIVLPRLLSLLHLSESSKVIDLGCGQGVLERQLSPTTYYQGLDISKSLIAYAKEHAGSAQHHFTAADVTRETLPIQRADFTHAAIVLALQNMATPEKAVANAAKSLIIGGKLAIVLNHPCFRIPRQSSWGIDEQHKTQYRRIDRYLTPIKIPITAHPGQRNSVVMWSFHLPLSSYFSMVQNAGFVIEVVEEWGSDKVSVGSAAKMENRSRAEFPLFLTLLCRKEKLLP